MEKDQAFRERCSAAFHEAMETVSGNLQTYTTEAEKMVAVKAEYLRILYRHGQDSAVYYLCGLCGSKQELSKIKPTPDDQDGYGYRLPSDIRSGLKVEGVEEICEQCYRAIMCVREPIYTRFRIDSSQAMLGVAIKLQKRSVGSQP